VFIREIPCPHFFDISKTIEYYIQKILGKKVFECRESGRINPAFDFLPTPFHPNKAGPAKLLYMMGYRRSHDSEILAEFPDTGTAFLTCGGVDTCHRSRLTARNQAHENLQPIRVGESLKHFGKFFNMFITIVRHISKYS
jgi:hypothetical protein